MTRYDRKWASGAVAPPEAVTDESISVFLRITKILYLFVFTQFQTQNRCTFLLELLYYALADLRSKALVKTTTIADIISPPASRKVSCMPAEIAAGVA